MDDATCPDCGAAPGTGHNKGCDVARCMTYGTQRIQCQPGGRMVVRGILPNGGVDVDWEEDGHDCGTDVWSGRWPGEAECEEFGWWSTWESGPGWGRWTRVPAGTPDARPDLNRLVAEASWDPAAGRWVR